MRIHKQQVHSSPHVARVSKQRTSGGLCAQHPSGHIWKEGPGQWWSSGEGLVIFLRKGCGEAVMDGYPPTSASYKWLKTVMKELMDLTLGHSSPKF